MSNNQRFRQKHRIKTSAEFDQVFGRKCSAGDRRLVVYGAANALGHPRLGLVVSRKVGPAVARNRFKRLLREAFRLNLENLPPSLDLVVIARTDSQPTLEAMTKSLTVLANRVLEKVRGGPT